MEPISDFSSDNFYKFLSIAGLTFIFASFLLFTTQYNNFENKENEFILEFVKNEIAKYRIKKDAKEMDTIVTNLENEYTKDTIYFSKINDKKALELEKQLSRERIEKKIGKIRSQIDSQLIINKTIFHNSVMNDFKTEHIIKLHGSLYLFSALSSFLFLIGCSSLFIGCKNWLEKTQRPNDDRIILELLKLRKELNIK